MAGLFSSRPVEGIYHLSALCTLLFHFMEKQKLNTLVHCAVVIAVVIGAQKEGLRIIQMLSVIG